MSDEFENAPYESSDGFFKVNAEADFVEDVQTEKNEAYGAAYASPNFEKKKGKKGGIAKKVCAITLSGVLFGAVAGGSLYGTNYLLEKNKTEQGVTENGGKTNNYAGGSQGDNKLTTSDSLASGADASKLTPTGDNLSVVEIAKNCMPSVVAITNLGVSEVTTFWGTYQQDSESRGSGVIIGQSDTELIILTNYHVVSGSKELTVVFSFDEDEDDPKAVTANVKGYDAERDIAVISIPLDKIDSETLASIRIAVIGDSEELELGEQVVAIGNALGYGQSVTVGYVSATDRLVELEGTDGTTISNHCIQTDAAINPGNSGGALLNMRGELVGINSAKISDSQIEGMGYAIPISDIHDLVNELMNREVRIPLSEEEQGYLCISGGDVSEEAVTVYGIPDGALVTKVYDDTAAKEAGIEENDIITAVNGVEVKSMSSLKKELSYYAGGEEVTITLMRQSGKSGYVEKEVKVKLNNYDDFNKLQEKLNGSQNSSGGGSGNNGGNGNGGGSIWDYFGY